MPISLIPQPRRAFLKSASFAGLAAALASPSSRLAASDASPWFALLADTHIDADPATVARGANMAENLRQVVAEILAEPTAPEFAIINGDCAYLKGLEADYGTLRPLIQPLLDAGIPIHLTMGNHDDRAPFFELFPEASARPEPAQSPADKHLAVIESEHANWFLLDTLQVVNKVTGELGTEQRDWLASEIDRRGAKPAMIVGHHYPQHLPEGSTETVSGLADTIEFMDLLRSKPQVKAYIYGHSHNYAFKKASGGIHLINQPPVAYLFDATRPNGWLRAELSEAALKVELRTLDSKRADHGEVTALAWK